MTTPTKNEGLPELVARWRAEARDMIEIHGCDNTFVCVADAREKMADELEAALTREAPHEVPPDAVQLKKRALLAPLPTKKDGEDAIDRALADSLKAVMVLSTMLRTTNLQGFAVADEIAGSIVYAQNMRAALATPPEPQRQPDDKVPGCEDCAYNGRSLCDTHGQQRQAQEEDNFVSRWTKAIREMPMGGQPPHQDRGEDSEHVTTLRELLANEFADLPDEGPRFTAERAAIEAAIAALTEPQRQARGEVAGELPSFSEIFKRGCHSPNQKYTVPTQLAHQDRGEITEAMVKAAHQRWIDASTNEPMPDTIRAVITAALTKTKQQGPGEALSHEDADRLMIAYDNAVGDLYADEETGWNQDNCRHWMRRRIARLRALVLRKLTATAPQVEAKQQAPTAVPDEQTSCPNCGSTDLTWEPHMRNNSGVVDGRLRMHDVSCLFVLGCNHCSETVRVINTDTVSVMLAATPAASEGDGNG